MDNETIIKKLRQLKNQRENIEDEMKDLLAKLPNGSVSECDCDESESISFIHFGNMFTEVISYCMKCGGMLANSGEMER